MALKQQAPVYFAQKDRVSITSKIQGNCSKCSRITSTKFKNTLLAIKDELMEAFDGGELMQDKVEDVMDSIMGKYVYNKTDHRR